MNEKKYHTNYYLWAESSGVFAKRKILDVVMKIAVLMHFYIFLFFTLIYMNNKIRISKIKAENNKLRKDNRKV